MLSINGIGKPIVGSLPHKADCKSNLAEQICLILSCLAQLYPIIELTVDNVLKCSK